jgi:NADPH:quinone reductase-like Zn-dependent oxidoreductase
MEVLTEEESRLVMESMIPPFTKHTLDDHGSPFLYESGQDVLLIHGPGQKYKLTQNHSIPSLNSEHEILVKVLAVGLNPIDWKGPDYNFGLPSLPWINGRDLAGVVVKAHKSLRRIRIGDVILSPSTDYRDIRKAAFQEYVISTEHNSARVPRNLPIQTSAALGVAFVAAALALGVCLGVNFSTAQDSLNGPDLFRLLREVDPGVIPEDIRKECLAGIGESERAKPGDWVAIWGGKSIH